MHRLKLRLRPTCTTRRLSLLGALWLSYGALRVALADLLYPQQQVLRPSHWVYRVGAAVHRQRLQQALRWTPENPWYWRKLAELEAQAAWHLLQEDGSTADTRQRAAAGLRQAAALYPHALRQASHRAVHPARLAAGVAAPHSLEEHSTLYAHLATLAPSNPAIQYSLGSLLLAGDTDGTSQVSSGSQRGKGALSFFRQALHLDTTYTGQVLRTYRQYLPPAEALYRLAVSMPRTPQGHLKAAEVLEGEFWSQARRYYLTALALGGSDPGVLRAYGAALQRHREFAAAREIWQRHGNPCLASWQKGRVCAGRRPVRACIAGVLLRAACGASCRCGLRVSRGRPVSGGGSSCGVSPVPWGTRATSTSRSPGCEDCWTMRRGPRNAPELSASSSVCSRSVTCCRGQ